MMTVSTTRKASNSYWFCLSTPIFLGRTTVPFCASSSPVSTFMKVDLPAPFGPGQAVAAAGGKGHRDVFEEQLRAVAHGHIGDRYHHYYFRMEASDDVRPSPY